MTRKQLETSTHAHCCLLQVCEWYVEPNLIYVLLVMRLSSMNTSLDIISTNKWGGNLRKKNDVEENSRAASIFQVSKPCFLLTHVVRDRKVNHTHQILSKHKHMSVNCEELSAIEKRLPLAN